MKKLIPIYIFAFILVYLSNQISVKEYDQYNNVKYIKKEKLLYFFMALSLAVFVGLRTSYNDTGGYRIAYESLTNDLSSIWTIDWNIGSNPGFVFTNHILKYLKFSTQDFIMFYSLITMLTYLWFIRKYSENILMSFFLFLAMGIFTFAMAAIKQTVAVAFCLIAVDRCIQKKYISFIFFVVIGTLFHPYSLMFLITPFLDSIPWTKNTFVLLIIFFLMGIGLSRLLGTLISVTTMFGEEYTVEEFSGDGVNVFRLAVVWAPILLSFLTRQYLQINQNRERNIIFALSMLNAEIMFVALFGTANYFARLANYFLIFQCISLPTFVRGCNKDSRLFMNFIIIICYFIYGYYADGILYGGIDWQLKMISFIDYLKMLLG